MILFNVIQLLCAGGLLVCLAVLLFRVSRLCDTLSHKRR